MQTDVIELSLKKQKARIQAAFFSYCLIIMVILLVRDVMGIYITKWLILIACIIPYIIFNLSYAMAFTIFLVPLSGGLPFNYICLCSLIIIITKYLNKITLHKYFLVVFLILIVELLSVFYGRFSMGDYVRFIAPLLLMSLLIFKANDDDMDYQTIVICYLFGAIGGELSVIWQSVNIFGIDSMLSAGVRLGETKVIIGDQAMRLSYNPNGLGRICAYAISALLVLMLKSRLPRSILIVILISQIVIGSLTLSRYFLLLIVVIMLVYLVSTAKSAIQFFRGVMVLCVVMAGIYVFASYFTPNVVKGYSTRIAEEEFSGGRIELGKAYFDTIVQNPERLFLGVGLQNYNDKVGITGTCHYGLQEVLITWGVTGLMLVTLYIWGLYKHGRRGVAPHGLNIIYLLPLIVILIGIQSGQFFSTHEELGLMMPYAAMRLAKHNVIDHS